MKHFLSFLFVLLLSVRVLAQEGGLVSGTVKDATGMTLPGAVLKLDRFNRYTVSDNNGYFEFLNVPAGSYRVEVEYLGYEPAVLEATVTAGGNAVVDFVMQEGAQEIGAVVVMGDQARGQAKALNQQKTNVNVSNVISADQIGRFPDSNIGDALKRVPGIAMQNDQGEARNIVVRGLASELNSVTLNGNRIPSAEGDNRKVQMDVIPSDMIQTIEVNKTLTPDMDADAIGGSVDLVTRAAAGGQRISLTLLGGYNPIRTGATGSGSFVYGNRFFNDRLGVVLSASYMNKDYGSDNIEAVWAQDDEGNVYVEEMDIRKYDVQRIRRSATLNIDWKIDSRNTIAADLMYNWRDDREARYRTQFKDIEPVYDGSAITGYEGTVVRETKGGIDDRRNRTRRLEDQRVQSYVLSGTHLLSPKVDMDWSLSYAKASEDRPHERYIEYVQEGLSMNEDLADTRLPYVNAPGQNYSDFVFDKLTEQHDYTQEEEYAAKVNLRMPLSVVREQKGRLRVGLSARWKNKRRSNDFYEYVPTGSMPVLSDMEHVVYDRPLVQGDRYVPGMFVSSGYIGNVDLYNPSLFTPEADPSEYMAGNYDAGERILAGYLRWDQNITNDLMFIAGVRVENTDLDYRGNYILDEDYDNADERHNRNNYTNVLPGLTLKYDLNDRTVLRAAFTTALARPNYYALVPYVDIQREKREITAGNPNLKATYSYNFDLLGEYYSKSVGIVSGGLFYKRLDNFIFNYLDIDYTAEKFAADFPGFTNPIGEGEVWEYLRPMNGRSVDMFGFEVALQRKLDFLPGRFLRNFGVMLNYTFTHSVTRGIYNEDGEERTNVSLPGTAPHMVNASLSWENSRLSVRVSLNYTAGYLDEVASEAFGDRYYDGQLFLDANASYRFGKYVRVFFEANNLTNQPLRYYQGIRSRMAQLEYYKGTFNLGVKIDF
ncbi:MAG TPA: TonB-dependent receptor [Candidatus Tidjanibacter gallistercoris]|nr:TonB-dependent receptor [Candidatus Tidjanibacter gallistercoris]